MFMDRLLRMWYRPERRIAYLLLPLSYAYFCIVTLRRALLRRFFRWEPPVPVVIVGNLTVGGAGKTPLLIAIAKAAQALNLRVGIVSRGYKSRIRQFPHDVLPTDHAHQVGDEPLLIRRLTNCPVVISPKRVPAVKYLLRRYSLDLVLSDDGLQHEALGRKVEISVIDGMRGFGNGLMLPAGPLREPASRPVDLTVVNEGSWAEGSQMQLSVIGFRSLKDHRWLDLDAFKNKQVSVVTGIGHPERFLKTLKPLVRDFTSYFFPDHHRFTPASFEGISGPIIMTEKDAVKCEAYAAEDWYALCVEATVSEPFWETLWSLLRVGSDASMEM